MDQIKIGKFIAECRKKQNLTQMQLAEKFGITDRAVSKWETGKTMPDSAIMLELCETLGITVNDLLNGEIISADEYAQKTAAQLVETLRQKEALEDRVLRVKTMLDVLGIVFTVIPGFVFILDLTDNLLFLCTCFLLSVLSFVFEKVCLDVDYLVGRYQCPHCKHMHTPSYKTMTASLGFGRKRALKCPNCEKKSWHIKIITKE